MKIGLIIIGRIKSTRLKKKMLLPLEGQTFIEQVFDQAKMNFPKRPIIFATPSSRENDVLAKLARRKGIHVARGHETDVLARYMKAVLAHQLDAIITWDGDDLFIDRLCLEKTRQLLLKGYDFVKPKKLPYGTFCYGVKVSAIKKVIRLKAGDKTEGWGRYFTQIPGFKIADYKIKKYAPLKWLRLTLDYPEDYRLIKKVFHFIATEGKNKGVLEAIQIFAKKFPNECLINQNRVDEYEKRFKRKHTKIKLKGAVKHGK